MAQRKSAKQTAARERARELAATHLEREQRLVTLAGDYFVAAADVEEVDAWEAQQIVKVREQANAKRAESEQGTRAAVTAVLAEGISKADAAKRLAITAKEITRLSASDASDGAHAKSAGEQAAAKTEASAEERD